MHVNFNWSQSPTDAKCFAASVPKTSHYLRWIIIKCQPNVTHSTRLVIEGKKRVIIAKPLSAEQQKPFFCLCAQNWFAVLDAKSVPPTLVSELLFTITSLRHEFMLFKCFSSLITESVVMTIKTEQRRTASTAVVNFNSFLHPAILGFIYRGMKFPLDACVKDEWNLITNKWVSAVFCTPFGACGLSLPNFINYRTFSSRIKVTKTSFTDKTRN